jgi:hypothetical protein
MTVGAEYSISKCTTQHYGIIVKQPQPLVRPVRASSVRHLEAVLFQFSPQTLFYKPNYCTVTVLHTLPAPYHSWN